MLVRYSGSSFYKYVLARLSSYRISRCPESTPHAAIFRSGRAMGFPGRAVIAREVCGPQVKVTVSGNRPMRVVVLVMQIRPVGQDLFG